MSKRNEDNYIMCRDCLMEFNPDAPFSVSLSSMEDDVAEEIGQLKNDKVNLCPSCIITEARKNCRKLDN